VRLVFALCAVLVLGACNLLKPYKLDIQQGNVITQEMVDKLRPGMTRSQVRYVLGTPLVVDPFHKDRWDYFYSYKKGVEAVPESRRLTLIFKDDVLHRIQGDVATREAESAPAADKPTS
jgi:outer membrane protein assembly factor BamE